MKKLFCLVTATIVLLLVGTAQETHFGIKAGVNVASVEVSNGADYDGKAGLHAGGLAHIHITRHFALQPEIVYSMQGGKVNDFKLKLNYINIPLLAQYMTLDGFRLQTGPQLGLLVSAKTETGNVEINRKDVYSSTDFSWVFGAGYLFPQGIGIDARYNLGISNIIDDNGAEAHNRVFQVGLFYQFMHNKNSRHK